ncbi:MAG: hypothetical protein R3E98_06560 [Gemmatimonadota bacterium]
MTYEEGTQAQWLHDLLEPRVARVLVCNRRGEKRQGNEGAGSTRMSCPTDCAGAASPV